MELAWGICSIPFDSIPCASPFLLFYMYMIHSRQPRLCFVLLLFIVIALSRVASAEDTPPASMPDNPRYVFQSMGDDVGLPTRGVTTMLQDSLGFVWIGTQDGLFRCDGDEVRRFDRDHGLADTWIRQLAEGPTGAIWVVAGGKIYRFDGFKFIQFRSPAGVDVTLQQYHMPQRIAVSSENLLYVATEKGLWRFDVRGVAQPSHWSSESGLSDDRVRAVYLAKDGSLWIATVKEIAQLHLKTGEIESKEIAEEIGSEEGASFVVDGEGTLWFRTLNHLLSLDRGADDFVDHNKEVAGAAVVGTPTVDMNGNVLVPSTVGLFLREEGKWHKVSARNGLLVNAVSAAIEDREGEIWIGMMGAGVQRWMGRRSWSAWTTDNGLPDDGVWGSIRDEAGRLWVATNDGVGIWLPNEHVWKVIKRKDGLSGNRIWKLAVGPEGWLWSLSRRTGFNRFDPETLEPHDVPIPGKYKGSPLDLASAPDGSLWISTGDELLRVRHEGEDLVFDDVQLPPELRGSHEVISIADDGGVWIGGKNGAGRFDGKDWSHFAPGVGLKTERVMNIVAVNRDEVWISYDEGKGVTQISITKKGPVLKHYSMAQGMIGDTVWMLDKDRDGRIWAGGSDGLSVIEKDGLVRVYDQGDGLIWNDINQTAFWAEPDGSVLIGTGRGLAYFRPTKVERQEQPPKVVITSAVLSGREVLREESPSVDYEKNTFTAKFAGLTFRNPRRVRYQYRLIGWNSEFVETKRREVRYAALPAGQYTLEVSCRSAAGLWSEAAAIYSFSVRPPWWERWWVRLGMFIILALLVLALVEFRIRRLAAERRQLEAAVAERSAQLAEANEELKEASLTDALTQTRNRRFFSTIIDDDISSTRRRYDGRTKRDSEHNRDLLFFVIDLDHFKRVNDIHGHAAGDEVLVETARRLTDSLRHSDLLIRWGGEEFLILCREADRAQGQIVAERILNAVGGIPFELANGVELYRTCSLGWAAMPAYLEDPDALAHEAILELADQALYLAKQSGRNRAVGIDLIQEAHNKGDNLAWLDESLEDLEGRIVQLTRVTGPSVPQKRLSSRPPPKA